MKKFSTLRNRREKGLVALEASMVFAVMLPLVFLIVGAAAYFYLSFTARSIANETLQSMDTKTFVLGGGHQDFFLHVDGQAVKELADSNLSILNNYLKSRIGRIPGAVACAEIGYLGFFIHEQSGRPLASSKITYNGSHQENFGFYPERPSPECASFVTKIRRIFTEARNDAEDGGRDVTTVFSMASGLKGVRLQADYGPSNIYDNPRGLVWQNVHGASEYLRETAVIGSTVIIDIRGTSIGAMMKKFRFPEERLVIEVNKVYSPRIDF